MPVLWVTDIGFSTVAALDAPGDKQDVTVTLTVGNSGNKEAVNASFDVSVDGTIVGQGMANVSKATGSTPGTATTTVVISVITKEADSVVAVKGAPATMGGGANATMEKNLTVPGDLDLAKNAAKSLTASPASQEAQRKVDFTVTLDNTGDADAVDVAWKIILHNANGTDAGVEITPAGLKANITQGGTNVTTWTWTIDKTQALGNFLAILHVGDTAANTSITVTAYKVPDLAVSFGKKSVSGKTDGKTAKVKVVVSVKNNGNAACTNVKISIWEPKKGTTNGVEVKNETIPSVNGGETANRTVTFPAKVGTNTYQASATCTFDGKEIKAQTSGTGGVKAVITTPGFEAVVLVAAVALAMVLLSFRRRKDE